MQARAQELPRSESGKVDLNQQRRLGHSYGATGHALADRALGAPSRTVARDAHVSRLLHRVRPSPARAWHFSAGSWPASRFWTKPDATVTSAPLGRRSSRSFEDIPVSRGHSPAGSPHRGRPRFLIRTRRMPAARPRLWLTAQLSHNRIDLPSARPRAKHADMTWEKSMAEFARPPWNQFRSGAFRFAAAPAIKARSIDSGIVANHAFVDT